MNKPEITVIGAGMGGSFVSYLLAKKGYKVNIFEAREDIRKETKYHDRSINQSLTIRGISILAESGVWKIIKKNTLPQTGRVIHPLVGKNFWSPYGSGKKQIEYSFNRNTFNSALLGLISSQKNININFNMRSSAVNLTKKTITFTDTKAGKKINHKTDLIIDSSGINSELRQTLEKKNILKSKRHALPWIYKSLYIPYSKKLLKELSNKSFHVWPRENCTLLALHNINGSVIFTIILPKTKFASLKTDTAIINFFRDNFPDIGWLSKKFVSDFKNNKLGKFEDIKVRPWYYKDFIALLGDSAHASTVFYGQGASAAFEDAKVLVNCIEKYNQSPGRAFEEYYKLRKPNTDILADVSYRRFFELKNGFRSPKYIAGNKLEFKLTKLLPFYKSLYSYICHTTIPYSKAYEKYLLQRKIARVLGFDLAASIYSKFLKN